ncbi:hypothetical protein PInf_004378 [Phytophthora infestans]|nr:hypothetical protein PInf_004378 [Phytophthora infestans]
MAKNPTLIDAEKIAAAAASAEEDGDNIDDDDYLFEEEVKELEQGDEETPEEATNKSGKGKKTGSALKAKEKIKVAKKPATKMP